MISLRVLSDLSPLTSRTKNDNKTKKTSGIEALHARTSSAVSAYGLQTGPSMDRVSLSRSRRSRHRPGLLPWVVTAVLVLLRPAAAAIGGTSVYQYNICNGLSNQLLYHASSIALGSKRGYHVEIPDYFIVNGVQKTDDNVLPSSTNSIPFGVAFDKDYFLSQLEKLNIEASFVPFDFSAKQIACKGMASVQSADPRLTQRILSAFRPSKQMQKIIQRLTMTLEERGLSKGICVHHRNGEDWHEHCARWGAIPDGIYRGNCLGVEGRSFVESLEDRGLTKSNWVYYCGDHAVPTELSSYIVLTKEQIMSEKDRKAVLDILPETDQLRDMWALIDFFACERIKNFIGNSVSTFSAIQIALRDGVGAYWYNTQSIPLAGIWQVFQMPIVYTYTELSASTGRHLLQSSIVSVRQHMPDNAIHVLYHGKEDPGFRQWLVDRNVMVHDHDPGWREKIEEMRLNGDPHSSHLFLHAGNYFGTWQRIDIPLFIESEYCLLLDADTVVRRPFTMDDFGLDLTYGIAMSSEMYPEDKTPSNAGVTLMNVPHLRQTYESFLKFILSHVKTAKFDHPSPSDQGAYLVFYKDSTRYLSRVFNFKPYWQLDEKEFRRVFIVHFHGPKPHDYIRYIMGKGCSSAVKSICRASMSFPYLCRSLHYFARASRNVDENAYCQASFEASNHIQFCQQLFERVAGDQGSRCTSLPELAWSALESVPSSVKLPRSVICKKLGIQFCRTRSFGEMYFLFAVMWLFATAVLFRVLGRKRAAIISIFVWMIGTSLLSYFLLSEHKGSTGFDRRLLIP